MRRQQDAAFQRLHLREGLAEHRHALGMIGKTIGAERESGQAVDVCDRAAVSPLARFPMPAGRTLGVAGSLESRDLERPDAEHVPGLQCEVYSCRATAMNFLLLRVSGADFAAAYYLGRFCRGDEARTGCLLQ